MHSTMLCSSVWQEDLPSDPKFLGTPILDAQLRLGITSLGVLGGTATGCWVWESPAGSEGS